MSRTDDPRETHAEPPTDSVDIYAEALRVFQETYRGSRDWHGRWHLALHATVDAMRGPLITELAEAKREVERLTAALQVCEHVAHMVLPTSVEARAAEQASGAWASGWTPDQVLDDLPDFTYPEAADAP